MIDFFANCFSDCLILAVVLLSMFPMVESKVAIPFALSTAILGEKTLSPIVAFFSALLGSVLPAIFSIWFARFIKNRTSGFIHDKFSSFIENRCQKDLAKLETKNSVFKKCLMLCAFVAIPLPLTGVYTGGLIAGFSKLKFWQGFLSILIGEIISCTVILVLCLLFENSAFYVLITSLILISFFVLVHFLVKFLHFINTKIKKRKEM